MVGGFLPAAGFRETAPFNGNDRVSPDDPVAGLASADVLRLGLGQRECQFEVLAVMSGLDGILVNLRADGFVSDAGLVKHRTADGARGSKDQ